MNTFITAVLAFNFIVPAFPCVLLGAVADMVLVHLLTKREDK